MNTIKTKTHNKYYSIHDEEPFQTSDLHKIINCNKATPAFTQEQQTIKPNNDLLTENNALLHKIIKQNKENNELLKALIKQNYVNAGHDGINSFHRY
jgi:hypothetical protein